MTESKCFDYLAKRGFLLHILNDGYWITNKNGHKVFTTCELKELKAHLKATYYGEPIAA
jgi:hypothetical protein